MRDKSLLFFARLKKISVLFLLIWLILLVPAVVSAAPTPSRTPVKKSPSPTLSPSPSQSSDILSSGSRGLPVLRLQLRLRELNYLNFAPTSSYGSMTRQAVIDFQLANTLSSDGTVGAETATEIFDNNAKRATLSTNAKLNGPAAKVSTPKGEKINWESANTLLTDTMTVPITDFNTGSKFQMRRVGGEGCAYMETVSNEDYTALCTAFANGSWEKRAVIVEIDGKRYGASLSGAPYGTSKGLSNMPGHVELFFDGSYSGILKLQDADHQRMIKIACGG